jgi:hypothetical protein
MNRIVRRLLVSLLIALHAAITLGGAGLHALPGFGHSSGLRPFAKSDHSHGPGKNAKAESDDCAVCQFLAQGQLSTESTASAGAWLVSDVSSPALPDLAPVSLHRLAIPRAPPVSRAL